MMTFSINYGSKKGSKLNNAYFWMGIWGDQEISELTDLTRMGCFYATDILS